MKAEIKLTQIVIEMLKGDNSYSGICEAVLHVVHNIEGDVDAEIALMLDFVYTGDLYKFFLTQEDLRSRRYGAITPNRGDFWFATDDTQSRIELLERYLNHLQNLEL